MLGRQHCGAARLGCVLAVHQATQKVSKADISRPGNRVRAKDVKSKPVRKINLVDGKHVAAPAVDVNVAIVGLRMQQAGDGAAHAHGAPHRHVGSSVPCHGLWARKRQVVYDDAQVNAGLGMQLRHRDALPARAEMPAQDCAHHGGNWLHADDPMLRWQVQDVHLQPAARNAHLGGQCL